MPDARLLVVDDDKNVRLTLSRALADLGGVDAAAGGREALETLGQSDYGLVLLDLRMEEMDGRAVLGEIRRRRPDVPVVLMSAHLTVETAVEAMRAGAFSVLPKPFTAAEVRAVAAEALAERAPDAAGYDERVALARAAVGSRLLGAAAEHARGALALDPTRPEAFNVLGVVFQIRGRAADARRYYGAAAALRPGYGPALGNLENLAAGGRANVGRFDLGETP